jgi:hypothetical protein
MIWRFALCVASWGLCVYMLSGCKLIDAENISLPSQNMKFGGE